MHDDFQDELLIIENVNEDTHYSKYIEGTGFSKKSAEQNAASNCIRDLK